MKLHRTLILTPVFSAILASNALALNNGITPVAGSIVNPYTGAEITAWRNVGRIPRQSCSGVQITDRWVLTARHCSPAGFPANGAAFISARTSASGVTLDSCEIAPPRPGAIQGLDMALCRLATAVPSPDGFPALGGAPIELENSTGQLIAPTPALLQAAAKWGYLLAYGHGGDGKLGLTDWFGSPVGFDPAVGPMTTPVPSAWYGDSGGAFYWISPTSSAPVLAGVIYTMGTPANAMYFTPYEQDWISNRISSFGDTPPAMTSAALHFTGTTGPATPMLTTPPKVRSVNGSRSNFKLGWLTPETNGSSISAFKVSIGQNGNATPLYSVSAGTGNTSTLTGMNGQHIVCVRPTGPAGDSLAAIHSWVRRDADRQVYRADSTNCTTFDTTLPASGALTGITGTHIVSGSLATVNFSWSAAAPAPMAYELTQTLYYASGPARTTKTESAANAYSVKVTKGVKACLKVVPLNDIGIPNGSLTHCVLAN